MISIFARYAPLNRGHILGFPNQIPNIDWKTYLPRFKYQRGDDASLHLARFYKHIYRMGVELHEYNLMKFSCLIYKEMQGHGMRDCQQGVYIPLETFI